MRQVSVILLLFILSGISFLMITCTHDIPDPLIPPGSGPDTTTVTVSTCSPDSVYFVNEIFPLINSRCATPGGCHDEESRAAGIAFTTYNAIVDHIVPGNSANSQLYVMITRTDGSRMPFAPRPALTAGEIARIREWIDQGARNNECTGNCDTTVFTYSGLVAPTIAGHCKGCHNTDLTTGGVDLSNYENVKETALDGDLMGTISQVPGSGHLPMPRGDKKLKLPDCTISQIKKWIDAGMPNN